MPTNRLILLSLLVAMPLATTLEGQEGYRLPPPEVVEIIDALPAPQLRFSPDKRLTLFVQASAMPDIAEISRRMLRLAGMRIDPAANARYSTGFSKSMTLVRRGDDAGTRTVPIPAGARIASVTWSHDSEHFAYVLEGDQGSHLYGTSATDLFGGVEPRLLTDRLNTVTGGVTWMPDGATLLCRLVPKDRGDEPELNAAPRGPNVSETAGDTSPLRTYQDLLSSAQDEALFEYYATTQLTLIPVGGGDPRKVGAPGIFSSVSSAPDGQHLLVSRIHRPYSYLMPWYSFPHQVAVVDANGKQLFELADIPLAENIPLGGVRLGPRSVAWNPHESAALLWVEALDGGDPKREATQRDRWMSLGAPFSGEPREVLRTEHRARGLTFLQDAKLVITSEYDRDRRWTRALLHDLSQPQGEPRVLDDRSSRDRYADPGRLVRESDERGNSLVRIDGGKVYRSGSGASPEGLLPFLDRQDLETLETERLWRCEVGSYERATAVLADDGAGRLAFLTRHESPTSPPNYRLRRVGSDEIEKLTDFPDPTPQLRGITKELLTYERADGVPLSATLYLPAGYEPGTRLPLLVWAYPLEYNDPKTAGQISSSPWRFTRISGLSHLVLLTQGYAIMDGATMPVVGDPETMNDTFVEQIVAASQAAIDKAVELGVADRERVVVGGHSYGAFMTANLLAHCDLFATGVARSGAYNRTLTPFGFQSERRTFWEAPEAYFGVSPFMHAHKINEPLLMIHGEIDSNSGTFPLQSERLFQAIKGNGGTARLVMLPAESHGYRARESVLHVHAETIEWFDRFLRKP